MLKIVWILQGIFISDNPVPACDPPIATSRSRTIQTSTVKFQIGTSNFQVAVTGSHCRPARGAVTPRPGGAGKASLAFPSS